jgi:hypothetical protein
MLTRSTYPGLWLFNGDFDSDLFPTRSIRCWDPGLRMQVQEIKRILAKQFMPKFDKLRAQVNGRCR